MADDIDDLLDEVESRFLKNAEQMRNEESQGDPRLKTAINSRKNDDISLAIEEICNIPSPPKKSSNSKYLSMNSKSSSDTRKRCINVFIGDASVPLGIVSSSSERCCGNMICLGCDFKVVQFENFKWKSDTDYLFLRNNVPEFQRLKKQLVPAKGYRAYACQCQWKNCFKERRIVDSGLKWTCASHD